MTDKKQPYDIFVAEEYERDGQKNTKFTTIGVAFENKAGDGFNCQLAPNIAVSGRFSVKLRTDRSNGPDQASAS